MLWRHACAGSATQVGVLIVPFCVILAWCMGKPLDLNFNAFEALVYFASVLLAVVMVIVSDPARVCDGCTSHLSLLLLPCMDAPAGMVQSPLCRLLCAVCCVPCGADFVCAAQDVCLTSYTI